jgi:hypothetical protein
VEAIKHVYEVRPRKDKRGVDLISDALPFGRLWYAGPDAVANAIGYAEHHSRSHDVPVSSSYQTESNEYTAAVDETLVSLTGFC